MPKHFIYLAVFALVACSNEGQSPKSDGVDITPIESGLEIESGIEIVSFPDDFDQIEVAAGVEANVSPLGLSIKGGNASEVPSGKIKAVRIVLDEQQVKKIAGKKITVTVKASSEIATKMRVSYSTNENGNSGWKVFSLTGESKSFSFDYDIPVPVAGNEDYIGILPVNPEHTINIESVTYSSS